MKAPRKSKSDRLSQSRGVESVVQCVVVACVIVSVLSFSSLRAQDPSAADSVDTPVTSRIVGGTESEGYPWMAAILETAIEDTYLAQICGGALVGSRWIMTAAHCLAWRQNSQIRPANRFDVLVGETLLGGSSNSRIPVRNIHVHPDYQTYGFPDIALLELDETVLTDTIRMEISSEKHDAPGNVATVAGWGWQSERGPSSERLLEVDLPITTHGTCNRAYRPRERIVKSAMVCAGLRDGRNDACDGDSGGPLFVTDSETQFDWLVGIVSFGIGCARAEIPGVYARVAPFTMWARDVMGQQLPSTSGENRLAAEFAISCKKLRCVVDAQPSTEGSDQIVHYRWTFGDEAIEYGQRVVHTYADPGEYRISLQISDAGGRKKRITKRLQVVDNRAQYHRVSRVWKKRLNNSTKSLLIPDRFGFYAQPGRVYGLLESNVRNLDLSLSYFDENTGRWTSVARSNGPTSNEVLRFTARRPGYYRWRVISKRGRGAFQLQSRFF